MWEDLLAVGLLWRISHTLGLFLHDDGDVRNVGGLKSTWRADRIRNPNTAIVHFYWQETKPTNQPHIVTSADGAVRKACSPFAISSNSFWVLHHLHVENKNVGTPPPCIPSKENVSRWAEREKRRLFCDNPPLSLSIQPYLSKCHMVHSVLPLLFPSNTDLRSGMVSRKTGARLPGWNHTHTHSHMEEITAHKEVQSVSL